MEKNTFSVRQARVVDIAGVLEVDHIEGRADEVPPSHRRRRGQDPTAV